MARYRRVEADQAGPAALGILVPPARRTFVILRPRATPWDLLVCRGADDLRFADLAHDEASAAAQGLYKALREWDGAAGVSVPDGRLCLAVGGFVLLACMRVPGQPYAPACATEQDAAVLRGALVAAEGEERELYFNMRFFERQ